jgi:PAS domain S-box-containing protein
VEVNPSYEKLFGYQLDEVRGKTTAELNYFEDPSNRMEAVRLLREQGSLHNYELEVRSRDGQLHTVMVSAEVIEMDGEDHFLTIFHDVTEGRRAERALHTQNARLLHYATELERSNQALEDFAIVAAHDLQEPLRKIKGFGDLLKSRMGVEISPEAQDYLDRIQQAAGRMQTMLDSLLAYSRVSTQNGQMQEVDLHTLVGEVLSDLEWRIEQTGAQVELGPLPILQADPTQMRQLFQNLLANALKFNQPEIAPVIKISSRPISATQFTISIEDNGVGFDEQQADDLFKPFHRLHPKARFEGNGMGLAICRKIVERHNGSISARSRPGQGSTFVVTLPLSPEY